MTRRRRKRLTSKPKRLCNVFGNIHSVWLLIILGYAWLTGRLVAKPIRDAGPLFLDEWSRRGALSIICLNGMLCIVLFVLLSLIAVGAKITVGATTRELTNRFLRRR